MTGFSAYFNGNNVYINGEKKYVLGEILQRILDKRYRELDKLYSECKRYETILHYPEDMREADESERLFQGAIAFYAKIEQMLANTPPYSSMDIQRGTLRTILNLHSWAFEEDEMIDSNTEEHNHFYVRIGSNAMKDAELLKNIYKLNDRLKSFAKEMRIFIEDILRVKRTFEPFLEKIHSQSRYLDNNETAQVLDDFKDKPKFSLQPYERLEPSGVMRLSYEVLRKRKSSELCQYYTFTTLGGYLYADQEHLKCGTYAKRKEECSAHFIRTVVLEELVLNAINKVTNAVRENESAFVEAAMQNSKEQQSAELKVAKKKLAQSEKRIAELDKLFTRLYEDNVSGKISDERFKTMSEGYEKEQRELRQIVSELSVFVEEREQKATDTEQFIAVVRKYSEIKKLTPEIMHEFIEKIVVHAPDKSSGHRTQQIDIFFRFNVLAATVTADSMVYDKKRKAA